MLTPVALWFKSVFRKLTHAPDMMKINYVCSWCLSAISGRINVKEKLNHVVYDTKAKFLKTSALLTI